MRQTVLAYVLSIIVFQGSVLATPVLADVNVNVSDNGDGSTSNVHVESHTGNNTICVNNNCTTSSAVGSGHATLCINGHCTTSDTGNISAHSDNNGHMQINIDNTTQSPTVSQDNDHDTDTTITPTDIKPTIEAKKKEIQQKIDAQKEEVQKKVQEHQSLMEQLFGHELDFFKSLFDKFL